MSVSVDGFIADREGAFGWSVPDEEQFRFHTEQVRELGGFLCGRRLYETMVVWETDPSLRDDEAGAAFADAWCAIPKVVFSRTLDSVEGNARLAEAPVAEEAAAALDATDKDVEIGGAGLAAGAIELGLVDELRIFRNPIVVGGGTPFLPPVAEHVELDMIETRTFGSRVIYERYARARQRFGRGQRSPQAPMRRSRNARSPAAPRGSMSPPGPRRGGSAQPGRSSALISQRSTEARVPGVSLGSIASSGPSAAAMSSDVSNSWITIAVR